MAPPMAASFAASFLLLPQPLMVPSSSPAALPQTPPLLSSSVLESRYFFSSGVVTESSTMRISALPLMRPAGLMNAIWPLTMLPSGTTVVPPETTGSFTTPANVSPGLFVLDVIVVSSRMRSRSEEHTSELQSRPHLVCRLLLEKKKQVCVITPHH